jgi:drug/metabolite transporter (DMT)-like permease
MSAFGLSLLLSLVSAVAYAGGAILQEHVAATGHHRYAPVGQGAWWVSLALNGVGALLHVGALVYGPLSLVQPLGALTIVFALPIATVFLRRRADASAWYGALMATVGLAGLLSLIEASAPGSLADGAGAVAGTVALLFAAAGWARRPAVSAVLLAGAAGVAFGAASVFIKSLAVEWGSGGPSSVPWLCVPAVVVFATAGVLLSQASYRGAGLTAPLATVTVVNPVVASAVGLTLFGESFRHGAAGALLAAGAALLSAAGLVLLTARHPRRHAAKEPVGKDPAGEDPAGKDSAGKEDAEALLPGSRARRRRSGRKRDASGRTSDQTVTPPALR